jgi:3D (Asp-Asp-Asp) domain-containing protein
MGVPSGSSVAGSQAPEADIESDEYFPPASPKPETPSIQPAPQDKFSSFNDLVTASKNRATLDKPADEATAQRLGSEIGQFGQRAFSRGESTRALPDNTSDLENSQVGGDVNVPPAKPGVNQEVIRSQTPTKAPELKQATATFYAADEDPKNGDNTAYKGPNGKSKITPGVTIATDPKVIPPGSVVRVTNPEFKKMYGTDTFLAHDTGSDVVGQKASRGKTPVIDFATDNSDSVKKFGNFLPSSINYYILTGPEADAYKKQINFGPT